MAFKYDESKDRVVKKFKKKTWAHTRLIVTAQSYDGGEPKIQILRHRRYSEDSEKWNHSKLGRLSWEEIAWLAKVLPKTIVPWYVDYFDAKSKGKKKKKKKQE